MRCADRQLALYLQKTFGSGASFKSRDFREVCRSCLSDQDAEPQLGTDQSVRHGKDQNAIVSLIGKHGQIGELVDGDAKLR
jgi:hypothetical protein